MLPKGDYPNSSKYVATTIQERKKQKKEKEVLPSSSLKRDSSRTPGLEDEV